MAHLKLEITWDGDANHNVATNIEYDGFTLSQMIGLLEQIKYDLMQTGKTQLKEQDGKSTKEKQTND